MLVSDHKLVLTDGTPVEFRRTPNQGGAIEPRYLVLHYTAGSSAEGSISWLTNPVARASAHLVIGRDGAITQLVSFDRKAWHAGASRLGRLAGLNSHSIGIELDNRGRLLGGPGHWRDAFSRTVPDAEVVEAAHWFDGVHTGWHAYTEEQIAAARDVAIALIAAYELTGVVGHDEIAPGRKLDPGPAFPLASFRACVLGRAGDAYGILAETSTALNIRVGPGAGFEKISAASPLPAGTKVEPIAQKGLWLEVNVLDAIGGENGIVGWVHRDYLNALSV